LQFLLQGNRNFSNAHSSWSLVVSWGLRRVFLRRHAFLHSVAVSPQRQPQFFKRALVLNLGELFLGFLEECGMCFQGRTHLFTALYFLLQGSWGCFLMLRAFTFQLDHLFLGQLAQCQQVALQFLATCFQQFLLSLDLKHETIMFLLFHFYIPVD
jgi:hypothetical protein